ncbi:hypothetical protein PLESTB_001855400 [Pleodorina starrii]|uniref:Uncharacterized protein n=1 Tax=Pleodorina starrii TaxID=330485 RepID=A0A9W6C1Y2_9CHLO|nr:hypothetical protein PLESTB_001855400 [Pleodorina starrii]
MHTHVPLGVPAASHTQSKHKQQPQHSSSTAARQQNDLVPKCLFFFSKSSKRQQERRKKRRQPAAAGNTDSWASNLASFDAVHSGLGSCVLGLGSCVLVAARGWKREGSLVYLWYSCTTACGLRTSPLHLTPP